MQRKRKMVPARGRTSCNSTSSFCAFFLRISASPRHPLRSLPGVSITHPKHSQYDNNHTLAPITQPPRLQVLFKRPILSSPTMSGTTQGKDHPPLAGFQDVNYTFKMKRKLMLSFSLCARMIGTSSGEAAPAPRLSAAQLQAAHLQALEKAALVDPTIDPFPPMTISNGAGAVNDAQQDLDMKDPYPPTSTSSSALAGSTSKVAAPTPKPINISDESAFPSLSGAGSGTKAGPTWGAGGGAAMRIKQQLSSAVPSSAASSANGISRVGTPVSEDLNGKSIGSIFTASVQLAQNEIHIQKPAFSGRPQGSSREAEPTTLGEVMKLLMKRHPIVTVEASTSRQITTFILKGKGANAEEEVAAVRRELMGRLAKKITLELPVPAGMRAFIIGVKGTFPSLLVLRHVGPQLTYTPPTTQVEPSSKSPTKVELKSKSPHAKPTSRPPKPPTLPPPTDPSSPSPSPEIPPPSLSRVPRSSLSCPNVPPRSTSSWKTSPVSSGLC